MKTQDRTHKDCPTSYIIEVEDFPDKDGMIHARFACPEHGVWWEEAWFERKQPEKQEIEIADIEVNSMYTGNARNRYDIELLQIKLNEVIEAVNKLLEK